MTELNSRVTYYWIAASARMRSAVGRNAIVLPRKSVDNSYAHC